MKIYFEIPEFFKTCLTPGDLFSFEKKPFLIDLTNGSIERPVFISILIHGNEHSSFYVLKEMINRNYNRSMIIFVGNVHAAYLGKRAVPDGVDYNRIWGGGHSEENNWAREVKEYLISKKIVLAIDIHNTSGVNPIYSCISKMEKKFLSLAQMFSNNVIYFTEPDTALSLNLSEFCPSITLECGKSLNPNGISSALDFLHKILNLKFLAEELEDAELDYNNLKIYQTVARIVLRPELNYFIEGDSHSSLESDYTVEIKGDIESHNFIELKERVILATSKNEIPMQVIDNQEHDVTDNYLIKLGQDVFVKRPTTPAMLSLDLEVARMDTLGYFMDRIVLNK